MTYLIDSHKYKALVPASVIIIAQNEEKNIGECIKSLLDNFDDIWVIDSYSEDKTAEIAINYGAKVLYHIFINYADQRNWALSNITAKYEWILYIDADEMVTPEFCQELREKILSASHEIGGMTLTVRFIFLGKPLRFARPPIPMLRIMRPHSAHWVSDGVREYGVVNGKIIKIKSKILHCNRKSILEWIEKQMMNANLKINSNRSIHNNQPSENTTNNALTSERKWRRWIRDRIYENLPNLLRPILYFLYRFIIKGGFLDGRAGYIYCMLQAFWYPSLIDIMKIEKMEEAI